MKIIIGKLAHETNTFSPQKSDFKRWSQTGWYVGAELVEQLHGKEDYISGMMRAAEELGAEYIPTGSMLDAGPLVTAEALDYALGVILDIIREHKDEIDGVCMGLHGAGCAEGIDDMESYVLTEIRKIVGPDMPIMITLDLHGNLSQEMVDLTQGIFGVKQYPHVDAAEVGDLAMRTLVEVLQGKRKTYTGYVKLPLLIPVVSGNTFSGPMKKFMEYAKAFKEERGLLDVTIFHGFPYTDRIETGTSVIIMSSVSQEDADAAARDLAMWIWERRAELLPNILTAAEACDKAEELLKEPGEGYIVINETSDNPGGGTPGDGTGLLRELLTRPHLKSILGYIPDAEVALAAHEAGIGGRISGTIGGKSDNFHGEPIPFEDAYVAALSDGQAVYNSPVFWRQAINYGKSARIRIGCVEVVVTEHLSQQTLDNIPFTMVGADIDQYEIVAIKSSNHFRAWFESRAKGIVAADTPGIQTSDLKILPFENVRRPIYPLDMDMEFEAK